MAVEYVDTYMQQAADFAAFPPDVAETYLSLGLASEAGELMGKLVEGASATAVLDECGDVLWYASQLARHHLLNLKELVRDALTQYEPGDHSIVASCAVIAAQAGIVAGAEKKRLRGDLITPSDIRRRVGASVAMIFLATHAVAEKYKTSLLDVMHDNIRKLSARATRGTIKGDGDVR